MVTALLAALDTLAILWLLALTRGWWRLRRVLREIYRLHTLEEDHARRRAAGQRRFE